MAVAFALRVGELRSWLWIDEGISVGLASHPLGQISGLMRQDGSPPAYYYLLHGWMALFGSSEAATHALSLGISLLAIPTALWAGWSLFGRRVGWTFAALVALSPFLAFFANETRMYALASLLSLVATACFLHAFAFGRRQYLWPFAAALALVLYTHNWGLWLAAALAVALVPCAAAAANRRRFWLDAAASFGLVGLAYLPWLPTLAYQRVHTGAPWSSRPTPREAISVIDDVLSDRHERVLVALLLVGGPALWVLLRRDRALRPAAAAMALAAGLPVVIGWLGAQVSPSWATRYLAVCAPAMLLLAALGLARAGTRGGLAMALILVVWVQPFARISGLRPPDTLSQKAAIKPLAQAVAPALHPGDLVLAMQMEEVPVLSYYLPAGLRYATALGPVAEPGVADWRDALSRMNRTSPATALEPELGSARVGSDVLLLCAAPGSGPPGVAWFDQMELRCTQWQATLQRDPRFTALPAPGSAATAGRQVMAFTKTIS